MLDVTRRWLDANPIHHDKIENLGGSVVDLNSLFEDHDGLQERRRELDKWVISSFSIEQFADLQSVFYIGRDHEFGELYETFVEKTVQAHQWENERIGCVHTILCKKNFVDGLIEGLKRVGQPSLSAAVNALRSAHQVGIA